MLYLIVAGSLLLLLAIAAFVYAYFRHTLSPEKIYTLDYLGKPVLGPYYLDLSAKLVDYPNRDRYGGIVELYPPTGESYFHPIRNTHYAFALYAEYLKTNSDKTKRQFLRMVEAIIRNGVGSDGESMVWYYPHKYFKNQKTPWISAMAQGQVVGVMARAFELTGEGRYLVCAKSAFHPFLKKIEDGGVCCDDQSLGVYYEEYAHLEPEYQRHTLNGMTSALFGIFDYWKISGDSDVKRVFDEGARTIKANLTKYDFPFCSAYDLRHVVRAARPLFNAHYNSVHVAHLHVLAAMTGDCYFDGIADCWNLKLRNKTNRVRLACAYLLRKLIDLCSQLGPYEIGQRLNRVGRRVKTARPPKSSRTAVDQQPNAS